jgi:hypothetical protein
MRLSLVAGGFSTWTANGLPIEVALCGQWQMVANRKYLTRTAQVLFAACA